jgi:DNA-directed RNA polymerase specialized sigma24 family protein
MNLPARLPVDRERTNQLMLLVLLREELERTFSQLTGQRETLKLYFYEGYTLREIGERRGETYLNSRNHFYRGLEQLRGVWKRVRKVTAIRKSA